MSVWVNRCGPGSETLVQSAFPEKRSDPMFSSRINIYSIWENLTSAPQQRQRREASVLPPINSFCTFTLKLRSESLKVHNVNNNTVGLCMMIIMKIIIDKTSGLGAYNAEAGSQTFVLCMTSCRLRQQQKRKFCMPVYRLTYLFIYIIIGGAVFTFLEKHNIYIRRCV